MGLPTRKLGRTGLTVTQLGYGAMEVRGERIWGGRPCDDNQAKTILNAVLDAGINFIDTANDYGKSELYIGRYLASRRKQFTIATKCGCTQTYAGDHDETHYAITATSSTSHHYVPSYNPQEPSLRPPAILK